MVHPIFNFLHFLMDHPAHFPAVAIKNQDVCFAVHVLNTAFYLLKHVNAEIGDLIGRGIVDRPESRKELRVDVGC